MFSLTRITIGQSRDMEEGSGVVSKLWLVDLGGSERLLKTGAMGQTLDEGKAINLSLSALGDVIAALKRKRNHIPYRNSKLTQILSDSLGDGSKVLMIVHISPSEEDVAESICSLSFAKRMRAIELNRELSEVSKKQKEKCIIELDQQINDTEEQLWEVKSQIEEREKLIQEKKLFPMAYQLIEDQKVLQEVAESPKTADIAGYKARPSSLPRFMTSTACSRQRQSVAVEIVSGRLRTLRLGNRGSVNFTGSQSHSHSDPYFKSNIRSLKSKLVTYETHISKHRRDLSHLSNQENPSCNSIDSKSSSFSRNKKISTSHPNFRVTLHQHRRMMSNLT